MSKITKTIDRTNPASVSMPTAFTKTWEKVDRLPWNPQFLRELKGRFKPINLIVATIISLLGQILLYLSFQSKLDNILRHDPTKDKDLRMFDRYCLGTPPEKSINYGYGNYSSDNYCTTDLLNNWVINWDLWHLDFFINLSVIASFGLLVVGSYLLVADLAKEETTGSFNFIRLGNQSANSIFLGKIFGVPCLLYLVFLLAMPLHLFTGIGAGIPISLILGFYTILIAVCFCCYSLAILFGLANFGMNNLKAFAISGSVLGISILMTNVWLSRYSTTLTKSGFDWFSIVYPNTFLTYLVDSTHLPAKIVNYLSIDNIINFNFYGINVGKSVEAFFGISLANLALCTYWIWQGIERKFRDSSATFLSKKQSYLLTLSVCFVFQGLTLQDINASEDRMKEYYFMLQLIMACFCVGLMFVLSPARQSLHDWARYRHLNSRDNRSLWKDLLWSEKSPATLAFAMNLFIIFAYTTPAIFIFLKDEYKVPMLLGSIVCLSMALVYSSITQLLFLLNTKRRGILALGTIVSLVIIPAVVFAIFSISTNEMPFAWMFTFLPSVAIADNAYYTLANLLGTISVALLGQLSIVGICNLQISRQLQRASLVASN
jgi:hypothetical protein